MGVRFVMRYAVYGWLLIGILVGSGCSHLQLQARTQSPATRSDIDQGVLIKNVGAAHAINILGLLTIGDASIATAAENTDIAMVDIQLVSYEKKQTWGLFETYTTNVYGR